VQLQPVKMQCMLPATPKSQPPTQNLKAASSTFAQQESNLVAEPHVKNDPSKSMAVKALPLKVAQMEVEPFKVAEPESCTVQTDTIEAEPEAVCAFYFLCSFPFSSGNALYQCPSNYISVHVFRTYLLTKMLVHSCNCNPLRSSACYLPSSNKNPNL